MKTTHRKARNKDKEQTNNCSREATGSRWDFIYSYKGKGIRIVIFNMAFYVVFWQRQLKKSYIYYVLLIHCII